MKVTSVVAESSTVDILLEAEHPAEIALVNLMGQCEATCVVMQPPIENVTPNDPKLKITVQIKKSRGY